jgi:hypothetical protein
MKQPVRKGLVAALVLLCGVLVVGPLASADHAIDLITSNSIPCYCQEVSYWCGAASAQMTLEGYPGGINLTFPQSAIWAAIQPLNTQSNWATDPNGMRGVLMQLGGVLGTNWVIVSDPAAMQAMYDIVYWMTVRSYPTPVLVKTGGSYGSFDHWVVITGFITDLDPTSNSSVTLDEISIFDPWNPPCPTATAGGVQSTMTGNTWFGTYWSVPGYDPAGPWHGTYVAVLEPPTTVGVADFDCLQHMGPSRVSADRAVDVARRWIEERGFAQRPEYAGLRTTISFEPLLVNEEGAVAVMGTESLQGSYYLVPFGRRGSSIAEFAVLVNAFDGEPQEVGAFVHPFSYLTEHQAIDLVLEHLCLCRPGTTPPGVTANLVTAPIGQVKSRFLPVWVVDVSGGDLALDLARQFIVTQSGEIFENPTFTIPGD